MDSARFIRNKTIMSAWLVTPLLLTAILDRAAFSYLERQKVSCIRNQALKKIIPEMTEAAENFNSFILPYQSDDNQTTSVQDNIIRQINNAAGRAPLTVTAIKLNQDLIAKDPRTVRIDMLVKGEGTPSEITAFLNHIKTTDPQIYETRISIIHTGWETSLFQLEADLSRIYIQPHRDKK